MMPGNTYVQQRTNRRLSASSSLVSCNKFANRTVSRLDLVEQDYLEWNAIQAKRENLLQYKSDLLGINSSLYDIERREAQLKANLARKYHGVTNESSRAHGAKNIPSRSNAIKSQEAYRKPIFVVSSRKKPTLVIPSTIDRCPPRSSHASLRQVEDDRSSICDSAIATHVSKLEKCHVQSATISPSMKQYRSTQYTQYLTAVIDKRVDFALNAQLDLKLDAKLDAIIERNKLLCSSSQTSPALPIPSAKSVPPEQAQVVDAEDVRSTISDVKGRALEDESSLPLPLLSAAPQQIVASSIVDSSVEHTICPSTNSLKTTGAIKMADSSTQTRYSSFSPSRVQKQKRLTLALEKTGEVQQEQSPYISHDELARMAQRVSTTSLVSPAAPSIASSTAGSLPGSHICCCESERQHTQNCPSSSSLPLRDIHRVRTMKFHKPSPLGPEYRHRASIHSVVPKRRTPIQETKGITELPISARRRGQQDSSVSLGVRMVNGLAFDGQPGGASRIKQGRGKLRRLLFGV